MPNHPIVERILVGGDIQTLDDADTRVSAMAIGNGRILAIGGDELRKLAGRGTLIEDLHGATVLPGLIDAHDHMLWTGLLLTRVQLFDCRSIGQIVDRVASAVRQAPPGTWILGRGWDESLLDERRHPTRHDLDPVSPENPVVLDRVWNRLVANSAAMAAAGVDRSTPDPPADELYSGSFERDETGSPTGLFRDGAKRLIQAAVPRPTEADRTAALRAVCPHYNSYGLTGVVEPGLYPAEWRAYDRARREGALTVRTDLMLGGWGWETAVGGAPDEVVTDERVAQVIADLGVGDGFGDDLLRLGGVKLLVDGGIGDRTARVSEPYLVDGGYGSWVIDPDDLPRLIADVHDTGWSMDCHTCGDVAQDAVVAAYAAAQVRNPKPWLAHRVHHAYLPSARTLALMARHRIGAVVSTPFLKSLGESFVTSLGEQRASRMMPMRTYLDHGVPLAGSSDTPVADPNPWIGIEAAVRRETAFGRVLGPDERLGIVEALRLYTSGGAATTGTLDRRGTLEAGKLADLIVLRDDPRTMPSDELNAVRPLATMVGGDWVFDAR